MGTIIRYVLITARRDWLFVGLFAGVMACYGLSVFTGATALVEQLQMSMTYFAGSSRIVVVAGLVIFVCFHVHRSFENREIEATLSRPISRGEFVFAYWLAFAVLALCVITPVIFILLVFNAPNVWGLVFWSFSLFCETAIILAFALVSALILKSAVSSVLASFAFYLISRLMGFFVAASSSALLADSSFLGKIMGFMLKAISIVIPRLDLYAKSSWLVYGVEGQADLWIFPVQSLIYVPLLLAMALFDFKRKQF